MNSCRKNFRAGFFIMLIQVFFFYDLSAQRLKRPPIAGIAFVELQVSDVKKAKAFYTGLLGYTVVNDISAADKKIHSFEIKINARQSIKVKDGLPATQDERLLCIAFQTTDAEAMRVYLALHGVPVPQAIHKEDKELLWFAVTDPDGHSVKFVQYTANIKAQPKIIQPAGISARILHAGLTVHSGEAANKFYQDILGFSEIWRGGASDSITSWINMRVPEGTDYIEYMLVNGIVNRQQLGSLHHIALMVPDMQQALDILNSRTVGAGYDLAAPRIGRNKRWQLNLFDADGTRIELMEPFPMR